MYCEEVAGVLDGDVLHEALPVLCAVLLPEGRVRVRARPQVKRHDEDTEVQTETHEPTDKPVMKFNELGPFVLNGRSSFPVLHKVDNVGIFLQLLMQVY